MQRHRTRQYAPKRVHPIEPPHARAHPPRPQIIQPRRQVPLLPGKQIHVARAAHLPNRSPEGIVDVAVGDEAGSVGQRTGAAEAVDVVEGFCIGGTVVRAVLGDEVQPVDVGDFDHAGGCVFLDDLSIWLAGVDEVAGLFATCRVSFGRPSSSLDSCWRATRAALLEDPCVLSALGCCGSFAARLASAAIAMGCPESARASTIIEPGAARTSNCSPMCSRFNRSARLLLLRDFRQSRRKKCGLRIGVLSGKKLGKLAAQRGEMPEGRDDIEGGNAPLDECGTSSVDSAETHPGEMHRVSLRITWVRTTIVRTVAVKQTTRYRSVVAIQYGKSVIFVGITNRCVSTTASRLSSGRKLIAISGGTRRTQIRDRMNANWPKTHPSPRQRASESMTLTAPSVVATLVGTLPPERLGAATVHQIDSRIPVSHTAPSSTPRSGK